jgi:hypothetical protein
MAFLGQRCAAEGGPGQFSRVFTGLEAKAILELSTLNIDNLCSNLFDSCSFESCSC